MTTTPRDLAIRIADGGPVRKTSRGGYSVLCPAHEDHTPSLDIDPGDDQPIVMVCRAGCTTEQVMAQIDGSWSDLMEDDPRHAAVRGEWTPVGPAVATYVYEDEHGTYLSEVLRTADKKFIQRTKDPTQKSGWRWNLRDVRRVLYRLPQVVEAVAQGQEIWVTEGEKDALNLVKAGVCATTNLGGAGKWHPDYSKVLAEASVTVVADRDEKGQAHARQVRDSLLAAECRVRVVEAHPDVRKDASDHLAAGHGLEDFVVTVPYEDESRALLAMDVDEYLTQTIEERVMVIPNCLARGEVVLVTGYEGHGKSTLLKQIAVQAAYGIDPWGANAPTEPRRVLVIDAENPTADNLEDFQGLVTKARRASDPTKRERLFIIECGPIDLRQEETLLWLLERVHAHAPDLLVMGPLYNLVGKDLRDEDDARMVMRAVQGAQRVGGCAVLLEHHVPHGDYAARDLRPIGSSLLRRWPNFGFGLAPEKDEKGKATKSGRYEFEAWRKGRRRGRRWPEWVRFGVGEEFPWVEAEPS